MVFHRNPSDAPTPGGCPKIQLSSDAYHPEIVSDPTVYNTQYIRAQSYRYQLQIQVVTWASDQSVTYRLEVPMTPLGV